jgi:S-DNA-T family DNA segregation ATPase FtsK/SpoIIIE
MARKKKASESKKLNVLSTLKEETRHGVLAVVFFVLAIFFILASFGKSGMVGNSIFGWFDILLGVGYFILPLLFVLLGVSFFKNTKPDIASTTTLGSVLFFISGLGIVNLVAVRIWGENLSGVIGKIISGPMLALFDFWASLLILIALLVISISVMFDTKPTLAFLSFWKGLKKNDEEVEGAVDDEEYEEEEEGEYEDEEELEEEETEGDEVPLASDKEPAKGKLDKLKDALGIKGSEMEDLSANYIEKVEYSPPPLSLLARDSGKPGVGDIKANSNIIKRTLQNFGITVEMDEISIGPSVTRYALKPAEGVKISRIVGLQNDLSLALAAHPLRIEAPIPGKSLVGIEIPNSTKTTVGLGTLLSANEFIKSPNPLMLSLGRGISGKSHFANLAKMPHMLIAGATGAGKSVTIHTIVTSLLFRNPPENMRFIMIDPKRVELTLYNKIPHLLTPVITDAKKAILSLKWAAKEMDRRYDVLESESVRDIASYHKNIVEPAYEAHKKSGNDKEEESVDLPERMPYIVIIIDELADIMTAYPRELESAIVRLAQMSRAVGIHLILSTQRPSVNVITGLIKANIPSRVALQVASQIDSRTILDQGGAEKLLGAGDMLFMSGEMSKPVRIQSAFISESEVKKVVKYLSKEYADAIPEDITFSETEGKDSLFESSLDDDDGDDLYEEAREVVIQAGKASSSYLQRKLKVGYARAARLIDMLEERGVVGPADGSKPREILEEVPPQEE